MLFVNWVCLYRNTVTARVVLLWIFWGYIFLWDGKLDWLLLLLPINQKRLIQILVFRICSKIGSRLWFICEFVWTLIVSNSDSDSYPRTETLDWIRTISSTYSNTLSFDGFFLWRFDTFLIKIFKQKNRIGSKNDAIVMEELSSFINTSAVY